MNYSFDEKKIVPKFRITDEQDIADCFEIEKMMQTRGWKILEKHFEAGIAQINQQQLNLTIDPTKDEKFIARLSFVLRGWITCSIQARELVDRARRNVELKKEKEDFDQQSLKLGGELG